jgi:integrase/recombinase XerC
MPIESETDITIQSFLRYLQFEKRYSPLTVKAYHDDLEQFRNFWESGEEKFTPSSNDYKLIRSWLVSLLNNKVNSRSVNRKISTLKSFYRYLITQGAIKSNPLKKVIRPKIKKKLPIFISPEHLDILLDKIDFGNSFQGIRNRLIIELLFCTGIRRSELITLEKNSVHVKELIIKVLGKRSKERIIPILPELASDIEEYVKIKNQLLPEINNNRLFLTEKGEPIYGTLVYRVVRSYLATVTTINKKSPHILRHSFATAMLNNGADLNAIREILGHSSLAATQVYTHNTFEKLKKLYN